MSQYFTNDKEIKNEEIIVTYTFKGKELKLLSNAGVFSKNRVDFGTNLLLNHLELRGTKFLDLGCGYGIVGVAIASVDKEHNVLSVDVNERAVELTNQNYKANSIRNGKAIVNNAYQNLFEKFDMIITNPPIRAGKEVVYEMVLGGINHLDESGEMWVVIRKDKGGLSLLSKMQEIYSFAEVYKKRNGYLVIKAIK